MNVVKEIQRLNNLELENGLIQKGSWHDQYKNSAWIYAGGLDNGLTEGDILWGEIEDINYIRDSETGKPMGFAFIKYEDQKSTILAIDNMNGVEFLGRTLRVDHKDKYTGPKKSQKELEEMAKNGEKVDREYRPGRAYEGKEIDGKFDLFSGENIFGLNDVKLDPDALRKKIIEEEIEKERLRRHEADVKARLEEFTEIKREINQRKLSENKKLATEVNGRIFSWMGRKDPQAEKAKKWVDQDFDLCYFCGSRDHISQDCPTGGQQSQMAGLNRNR